MPLFNPPFKTFEDPRRTAAQRRGLIALLIAMTAVGSMSLNILVPALPRLAAELKTDPGSIQLTVSLYLTALAVSQLLLGPLSDRWGRRPVVLAGIALAGIASLIAIFATTIGALIVARMVQAVGASTGVVIGRAIIRDIYERERAASILGLVTAAMVIVPMLSPLIGGILDTAFGWEAIFIAAATFSFTVLVWATLTLPETRPQLAADAVRRHFLVDLRALAGNRRFAGYVLNGALGSAVYFTFLGGAPYVVVTMMGRSSAEFGIWFACSAFGYMAGNYSASRWAIRYGIDAMIWWGTLLTLTGAALGVAIFLIAPATGPLGIFLPQLMIAYGNGLLLPTSVAGAVSIRPEITGTASGITGFTQMALGAAAAQVTSHALAHASTPMPMLLLMLGFGVATLVGFLLLLRRPSRDVASLD